MKGLLAERNRDMSDTAIDKDRIAALISIVNDLREHKHEEEWYEFKVNWFEPHALGEYISAMSNAAVLEGEDNAYFIWGVHDKTHDIEETQFDYHQDVKNGEPLQHYLARQLTPDIGFRFDTIEMEGRRVVILTIPAAVKSPTAFDKVRYLRIGSSKVNLMDYPERESRLFDILRNGLPTIDNTESKYQDLTFDKLMVYYESKGVKLNKRTFKKNLGLLTADGKYNILAQLLSDNSHIPVRFSLFTGKDKASTMYAVREFGNTCILYSLDKILEYGEVLNVPQADERNRVVERKEVMLFSDEAYHEAVINAFVHNLWIDGNAPMFSVFQDRIEILSRGKLPPKQTIEGFYAGESVPVNQGLSDVFLQLHISERSGRGVPKIVDVYGRESIVLNENSITVTIPFNRLGDEVYAPVDGKNAQVGNGITPVMDVITPVITPATEGITPVITPETAEITPEEDKKSISRKILSFCTEAKSILEIAEYLGYKEKKTVRKYLKPLLQEGRLAMTIPENPNNRFQKYITIK